MKKVILCGLIFSTMLLFACNKTNLSSEVSESVSETINQEESHASSMDLTDNNEGQEVMDNLESEEYFNLELKATDNPRIAELLNVSGTYTDSVGNVDNYHYQIPQFNADSESAKALNERIMYDIVDIIQDEFFSMDEGYSLFCYNITYEVVENGEVVAILVSVPYPNDCVDYYAYTYDFEQDKEISNSEMLAMHGWTEEAFVEEACRREKEHFESQISDMYSDMTAEDVDYFIQSAADATTVDLPMYIGVDGVLYVYLPMPSLAGADWYYRLEQF